MENQIESLIENTINNMKTVIDTDNVIGKPIISDGNVIIPISKVSFGFVTGGGEYSETVPKVKLGELPHAGAGGGGVTITPIGFLVCKGNTQNLIKVEKDNGEVKWLDLVKTALLALKH